MSRRNHYETSSLRCEPLLPVCRFLIKLSEVYEIAMMNNDKKEQELREPDALPESEGGDEMVAAETLEEPSLSSREIEALKEKAAKAGEQREQMLRIAADFDNFK